MTSQRPREASPTRRRRACTGLLLLALVLGTGCGGSAEVASRPFNMPPMMAQTVPPDPAVDVGAIFPGQTNINANPGGGGGDGGPLVYGDPLDDQFNGTFDPYNPPPELQDPPPSDFWP